MSEPLSAERLLAQYFLPLYPPDARADLAKARATDANPAGNPAIFAELSSTAEIFAKLAPDVLGEAGEGLDYSPASVRKLARGITRERRDAWLRPGAEGELPLVVNVVLHGSIYVGECIVRSHGGTWQVRRPLWESMVRLTSRAGTGDLAVFHWWLKALSDEEIDDNRLADRFRTHVEVPTLAPEDLPVIAPPDRKLPRLAKVRYDTLYKYLRAHLPELRSVGDDFPSPERLDEMAFQWLDFTLVGDGRMLVMHGPTDRGVYVFWLDAAGFNKSAYYPADAFPEHVVQAEDEKLRVIVPILGAMRVHETLWWGA